MRRKIGNWDLWHCHSLTRGRATKALKLVYIPRPLVREWSHCKLNDSKKMFINELFFQINYTANKSELANHYSLLFKQSLNDFMRHQLFLRNFSILLFFGIFGLYGKVVRRCMRWATHIVIHNLTSHKNSMLRGVPPRPFLTSKFMTFLFKNTSWYLVIISIRCLFLSAFLFTLLTPGNPEPILTIFGTDHPW